MSIKIYNGLRFKFKTLDEVFLKLKTLKKEMLMSAQKQEMEILARMAARRIDLATLSNVVDENPLVSAWHELNQRQFNSKITNQRDTSIDFSFSLLLIPTDSLVIGTYYTEQKELLDILLSNSWVEEYGYWDSTDPSNNISQFEWENRKKTWTTLLNTSARLDYHGLSYVLTEISNLSDPYTTNILKYIPSLADRAKSLATDLLISSHLKSKFGDNKIESAQVIPVIRAFLENPTTITLIESKEQELLTTLKSITFQDLITKSA